MAKTLSILNDPPTTLEGPQSLHSLINFEEHGDTCALDFTSHDTRRQYTYCELKRCIDILTFQIQEFLPPTTGEEVARQHVVPILLPQSPSLYISQLAILHSGGAFCPINLDAPKERVKFVVGDVAADIVITTAESRDLVQWENGPKVIIVEPFPAVPTNEIQSVTSRIPKPLDLAYVMYTSGSSGTPKGVALSHRAATQSLLAHERFIPPFQRFLQFAAPSFDVSVFEIFFPLKRGATLVGCERSQLLNDLPGMINSLEVDAAELTPTVVGALLQKRSHAPGLRLLLTIGEMLTRPIVEEFGGSDEKEAMLYGMYGPTEAAIHCTIYPAMRADTKPGNIGIPFDTVSAFVAAPTLSTDEAGNLAFLPMGETGELVLGGPQLAQGYLNRPDQNKAAFINFDGKDYYRTGDKARLLEDGTIEIMGRISAGQVKLRGQRVELGEIEEAAYKHSGIKTVAAVVLANSLIVFALIDDQNVKSEDVLQTCAKWLPKFMIPNEIILLQKFPYLPSGKVNKRQLEADYLEQRERREAEDKNPFSPTEQLVNDVLQKFLGSFSPKQRLTAAGLDSLVAIRVASELRVNGFNVTTVAVVQAETLADVARLCEHSEAVPSKPFKQNMAQTNTKTMGVLNGNAKDVESTMPCTPLQSAMLAESAVDKKAYRNWVEVLLSGDHDLEAVISALRTLAEYNEILRTGFVESHDFRGYVQVIWKSLSESQLDEVNEFNYDFDVSKDASLHHPLRVQIQKLESSTKLLIHLHHALYDAWSLELLLDDLDMILVEIEPPARPAFSQVVNGYSDGTLDIESWASKDYWKDHLLHLDPRQMPNYHTKKLIPPGLVVTKLRTSFSTAQVEATARSFSSSPQAIFQAAYALILSSYLGSSDICFGTVFSGRTLPIPGIENIAGPCLATLPIRADISTSATLQDLVQEFNATNRKHLEHSVIPLRDIKLAGGVAPGQPLFDTLLIWQQTLHSLEESRKHVSLVDSNDNLEYNLTLEITPTADKIELKANYQQSLLPKSQVDALLKQIEQVVDLTINAGTTRLDEVSDHLDSNLLSIENEAPQAHLKAGTLASPVETIAANDPERPAIEFAKSIEGSSIDSQRISYGELNSRSNQMGHYLVNQSVLPDELVCICMEKSIELYVSILAATKAGAGYLPVTPDIPLERLQHILQEAKVKTILAQSVSRPLFKTLGHLNIIYVDEVDFGNLSIDNLISHYTPDNLSYCVFTSGSTGTPKGVLVTQGNLLSNLEVLEEMYPEAENTRLLQSCSQAFDVSVFEIFFTWRIGACLCSAVKDVLFRDIENAIRQLRVTHLSLTPTVASLIDPANVPGVQFLVTAGEAVTPKVFNLWADRGLWQGYGPSETTNICTVNAKVTRHDLINNIGPPFKNTSAFVLAPGPNFSLVPRGGEGEFCFGGSQVFRGYMNSEQETGKILLHPKYGRLYRSGDFGRLMPDGSLAFTARKDDQVKIRGQRVELGEINNLMLRADDVRDCVTMVINSAKDNTPRLVCFWAPYLEASKELNILPPNETALSKLFQNLESNLPSYMIPTSLIPISFLPSTSQGKIDKRLLEKQYHNLDAQYLESTSQTNRSSSDQAWSDLELEIAKTLADFTDTPRENIRPDTSFFNLGIDSISAIGLSRALRQATEYNVEISDILKSRTVARLAERLALRSKDNSISDTPVFIQNFDFGFDADLLKSIHEKARAEGNVVSHVIPCTPLQEAMISAGDASSGDAYRNHVAIKVSEGIDVAKLGSCLQQLVQRHEILRTCFVSIDMPRYPYVQVVLEKVNLTIRNIEGVNNINEALKSIDEGSKQDELDLSYSFSWVSLEDISHLLISMHHALYDGVALTVLYEEVERLYHGEMLAPAVSFVPFIKTVASLDLDKADQFWRKELKDLDPTRLEKRNQVNERSESLDTPKTEIHRVTLDCSLEWVEMNTKKHSTSLLAVLHAVWASIISDYCQQVDVCFGNVVSGRTIPLEDIERLVAPCFNTIPSRLQNTHKLSYLEAFRTLQFLNADSLPFSLTPLRRIQSQFSPDGSRLFDTLFILQQPPRELDSSLWSMVEDDGAMDFPLVCEVVPNRSRDTLEIVLHSRLSVVPSESAITILESFERNLKLALENPRRQLLSSSVKENISSTLLKRENKKNESKQTSQSAKEMDSEELKLRDVFASFTNVPKEGIKRDVSIFRLGFDSISTVQVATRLRKLGYNVMASDILQHPTIAQLSAHLAASLGSTKEAMKYDFAAFDKKHRSAMCSQYGIQSASVQAIRPCTAVQQGMLAQSLHSHGEDYVNSMSFELSDGISLPSLKEAWKAIVTEHEMLRTGFVQTKDSKHPFAMITYRSDAFSLPWSEGDDETQSKLSIMENLYRGSWNLNNEFEKGKQIIKFTAHHALFDGQTLQMIFSDVAKAISAGSCSSRRSISGLLEAILVNGDSDIEAQKAFWAREENKIVVNKFPDLTPLRVSDGFDEVIEYTSKTSTSELEESCRKNEVTMQAAAQAAWARLLAAYIGESSTTFGVTLSGRSIHENADETPFPSIVTLPVRCNVSGTNADLLARTLASNAALHKYQFTPLTSIQKWAGYPEGRVFDTLFAYQKLPEVGDSERPWKIVKEEASVDYTVSMEVQPTVSGKLTLRLTFKNDLIPKKHAELILRQYEALLLDTISQPQSQCDMSPSIGQELLSVTPAQHNVLPDSATLLHQYVERGARTWPHKNAFEFATSLQSDKVESRTWTYKQLDQTANRVAHLLLNRGVASREIVAICFDKCPEASFAIIGILKAGCAYVALDPNAPAERLKFIVKDAGAKLVFTAKKQAQNLMSELESEVITLDTPGILSDYPSEAPQLSREIDPQDTSYCLYTSGTTGTPKGCLISHENAVQAMLAFQRLFADHWDQDSKWLQFASFHFDVSVLEQFWSWSVGICVASAPRDLIFEDVPGAIQALGITHIDLTPSLARLVHPDDVPSLWKGVFITGGEQLKQEILDVWGEHACIYNGYGPTEATIGVTMYPRVPKTGKPSNIGPQFVNVGSFVLKPGTSLPVLRGGIGELCVSGKLVGQGYLNRPDLTTEKFPTLEGFNERVYRTGDLVRILQNGDFIFHGRADDQVKLRGQRLELSEINQVVKKSTDDVEDVVTLVLKHSTQQKDQLVTFFVATLTNDMTEGKLISRMRDACKSRLPGYMVPTHFIPIKAIPLTPNNKADAKNLAATYNKLSIDDLQKLSHSSQQDEPWTERETKILRVLAKALDVDISALDRGSNIFELGLDSISLIGFSRSLQDDGLENAKLSLVKNNPAIDALVQALLQDSPSDLEASNAYIAASQSIAAFAQKHIASLCRELIVESRVVECVAPCTPIQQGMIYQFLESDGPLYFNGFQFLLDESVDQDKLLDAWNRVIAGLQILRTKFVATDDGFAQVVLKELRVTWESFEIDYETADKAVALRSPYKISLSKNDEGTFLRLQLFHGLYDGNSLELLLRHVCEAYRATGEADYGPSFHSSLPHGPLATVPGADKFWTEHLRKWRHSSLPNSSESTQDVVVKRSLRDITEIEMLRKQLGVTHQSIIQTAWLSILQSLTSTSMTLGVVTSGRTIDFAGADKVVGPLFNTVPFHISLQSGLKAADLIQKCHGWNMQMQDFQHTPLKDIQRWAGVKPGQRLFDTLFVFQRGSGERFAEGIWRVVEGETKADYPLAFEATLLEDGKLDLVLVVQGSVLDEERAGSLIVQFEDALRTILAENGQNVVAIEGADAHDMKQAQEATVEPRAQYDPTSFTWTKEADIIRAEIAALTNNPEDQVQQYSSIFELGLDSIDVIKLASRLKKRGVEIAVSAIIRSQTIAKMLPLVSAQSSSPPKNPPGKIINEMSQELTTYLKANGKLSESTQAVWPATPLQQSMVNEMLRSDFQRYFNLEVFELSESTEVSRLIGAVEKVIIDSPILRTSFVEIDDLRSSVSFAQIVHKHHSGVSKSTAQSLEEFTEQFRADAIKAAAEDGRLYQLQFLKVKKKTYMLMAISHALYDGTSLRTLHLDISHAYYGESINRPDFVPYLEEVFKSTTDDAKSFWKTTLSNLPPTKFPLKQSPPPQNTVHRFEKSSNVSLADIQALCKTLQISLQTLGQTLWALVLSHLTSRLDVVFGSVLSCRDSEEANAVMFPLMNTVAVRSVLHGTLEEMLRYMQDLSDNTRQYQHFPLGMAQAYALASRESDGESGDASLFDTLFIYQGKRAAEDEKPLYRSVHGASEVEFPVCVEMEIYDEKLNWTIACKSQARDDMETRDVMEMLDAVLAKVVQSSKAQTLVSDKEGVSICGLPKFQLADAKPKKTLKPDRHADEQWSETELSIRKALHEISDADEDSIHKNTTIFHLGLDSILVLKLPKLLRSYGITLKVSDILRDQTVAAMARTALHAEPDRRENLDVNTVLAGAVSSESVAHAVQEVENEVGAVQETMPVTAGQLYMLRMWQVSKRLLFYPTFKYSFSGSFNKEKLETAWRDLQQSNEILRTGFVEVGSEIFQVVYKEPQGKLTYGSDSEATPRNIAGLRTPPLSLVVEEMPDSIVLKLSIHHALYDGISLPILVNQLQSLYLDQSIAKPESSFRSFVAQAIDSKKTAQEAWTKYLTSETLSPIKKDTNVDFSKRTEVFHPARSLPPLKETAKQLGVTLDALFLTVLSRLYAQHLQSTSPTPTEPRDEVIIGIYLANRAPFGTDLSSLAAPTLNLLPLRVRDPLRRDWKELALEVQADLQRISSEEMSATDLQSIHSWTGVGVQFWVNILRDANGAADLNNEERLLKAKQDLGKREMVVEDAMTSRDDGEMVSSDAYLPSIDVEIRYTGDAVDMGVFAPASMLGLDAARSIIDDFVSFF